MPPGPLGSLQRWAERDPDRIALRDDSQSLTFGELMRFVTATAASARRALRDQPDGAFLPVLVDRSAQSAALVLACLLGRVRFFPVDSRATPHHLAELRALAGGPTVFLAGPAGCDVPGAGELDVRRDSDRRVDGDEVAGDGPGTIVFSSGSTGRPKGIVLSWRALDQRWSFRDAEHARLGFGDDRRQALLLPLDAAWGLTVLADLASGFATRIIDPTVRRPTDTLADLAEWGPTTLSLPPQLGRVLSSLPPAQVVPLPGVRWLYVTSEGFRYEYADGLRAIFPPSTTMLHTLASTEAGRMLMHTTPLADLPSSGQMPVGRPAVPDAVRFVEVPDVAEGVFEVHATGAVAEGYLDPQLTAERFYRDADGRRWWRSGDLVRLGDDGCCWHHGRVDDLVKVGGRLVSAGAVTAVLTEIDGVAAAVTIPVVTGGTTRLVAHVEVRDGADLSRDAVRAVLVARLPAPVVPAALLRHRRLPASARGKVDRAALMNGPFEPW